MTQQLEMFEPDHTAPDHASTTSDSRPSNDKTPAGLLIEESSTRLLVDTRQRRIESFRLDQIEISRLARSLNTERVEALMESIQRIGMLNPIAVRMLDGAPHLVYGRHRLAAAQSLGWVDIECYVLEADDRRARMAEIAENLHRAELSELERSEQIAEWLKLAAE